MPGVWWIYRVEEKSQSPSNEPPPLLHPLCHYAYQSHWKDQDEAGVSFETFIWFHLLHFTEEVEKEIYRYKTSWFQFCQSKIKESTPSSFRALVVIRSCPWLMKADVSRANAGSRCGTVKCFQVSYRGIKTPHWTSCWLVPLMLSRRHRKAIIQRLIQSTYHWRFRIHVKLGVSSSIVEWSCGKMNKDKGRERDGERERKRVWGRDYKHSALVPSESSSVIHWPLFQKSAIN